MQVGDYLLRITVEILIQVLAMQHYSSGLAEIARGNNIGGQLAMDDPRINALNLNRRGASDQ
jgi:hypothetical protein